MDYSAMDGVPGKRFFRCEPMRATLSTDSCAGMWRRANDAQGSTSACRNCPLGAVHAGCGDASMSPLKGTLTCARCHRGAERLVTGGMYCLSCYNRAREARIGRNAKGGAPVKTCKLEPRRLRYSCGGEVRTLALRESSSTDELVVAVLRDSDKRVRFGFHAAPRALRQMRLFD